MIVWSKSTLFALTAYHCGAKPWSEPANVVGLPPISVAGDPELLVGVLVGAADVALADRDPVGRAASGALDVVELGLTS